jgi:hypothetical protein
MPIRYLSKEADEQLDNLCFREKRARSYMIEKLVDLWVRQSPPIKGDIYADIVTGEARLFNGRNWTE